jgi:hypothetical protein
MGRAILHLPDMSIADLTVLVQKITGRVDVTERDVRRLLSKGKNRPRKPRKRK